MTDTLIVVPCFNEAQRLDGGAFCRFAAEHPELGFVLVDDGSSDATLEALCDVQSRLPDQFDVLPLPSNQGKAEAVRHGMLHALKRQPAAAGFWDADLATPLEAIPLLRDVLRRRPDVSVVLGSRMPLLGRRIRRAGRRRQLGRVFARLASAALGLSIYDTQCGAKLFRADPQLAQVFAAPFSSRWIFDVEILARWISLADDARQTGVYEQPVDSWIEVAGSRLKPSDFVRAAAELGQIAWHFRRGRYGRSPVPAAQAAGVAESAPTLPSPNGAPWLTRR